MSSTDRGLLADLQDELRGLMSDVREMLQLRWDLARLEIKEDLARLKRLIIICVVAAVMALTSLPLLLTCLADTLDGWQGIARWGWLLIFGLTLLCTAAICAYGGMLWFRRRFVGLQESLEEMREDLQWAKEGRDER